MLETTIVLIIISVLFYILYLIVVNSDAKREQKKSYTKNDVTTILKTVKLMRVKGYSRKDCKDEANVSYKTLLLWIERYGDEELKDLWKLDKRKEKGCKI